VNSLPKFSFEDGFASSRLQRFSSSRRGATGAGGGRFPRAETDASVRLFQACFSFLNVELGKAGNWPMPGGAGFAAWAALNIFRMWNSGTRETGAGFGRGSSTSFNLFGSNSPKLASAWLWPASARSVRGRRPRLQGSLFQCRGALLWNSGRLEREARTHGWGPRLKRRGYECVMRLSPRDYGSIEVLYLFFGFPLIFAGAVGIGAR
jgi:hypothetical protein